MSANLVHVKVILIGDSKVGKTYLLDTLRYPKNNNPHTMYIETIGVDLLLHRTRTIEYQIWDTSGSERYAHILRTFIRRTNAVIFVYNNKTTYQSVVQKYETMEVLHNQDAAPYVCVVYTGSDDTFKRLGAKFTRQRALGFECIDLTNNKEVNSFWKKYSMAVEDKILQEDWLNAQARLQQTSHRSSYWCYNWFTSWYGSR